MDRRRCLSIARAFGEDSGSSWNVASVVFGLVLIATVTTLGLTWSGGHLHWLGVEQVPLRQYRTRELMSVVFFSEWMWHAWICLTVLYWIPSVLIPLSRSLSPAGSGWLRMTNATPIEARIGIVLPAFVASTSIFAIESAWVTIAVGLHGLPFQRMATPLICGYVYHISTIAFVICPLSRSATDRQPAVLACIGFLFPLFLFLVGWVATRSFQGVVGKLWPFSVPYVYLPDDCLVHAMSLALLSAAMVCSYFFTAVVARVVVPPGELER